MVTQAKLRRAPLLATLEPEEMRSLAEIATVRQLNRRDRLFDEGDPATHLFVLLQGTLKLHRNSLQGGEIVVHVVGSGEMFAEAAALGMETYPVTATALDDAEVACLPSAEFADLVQRHPGVALKLITALGQWLRRLLAKIDQLTQEDATTRLVRFLLEQNSHSGREFALPMTKGELASSLGMAGETLSRSLKRLKDDQAIELRGSTIRITDPEKLRSRSQQSSRP